MISGPDLREPGDRLGEETPTRRVGHGGADGRVHHLQCGGPARRPGLRRSAEVAPDQRVRTERLDGVGARAGRSGTRLEVD